MMTTRTIICMSCRYSLNERRKTSAVHVMVRFKSSDLSEDKSGDAPSLKAITLNEGLAYKFYWRMGVHNYCMNYDGSFLGESMPYNDIAIALKASIPSNLCKENYRVKLGVKSQLIVNDEGKLIDKEYVSNMNIVSVDNKSYSSIKQYEEDMENLFYAV